MSEGLRLVDLPLMNIHTANHAAEQTDASKTEVSDGIKKGSPSFLRGFKKSCSNSCYKSVIANKYL